MDTQNEPDTTAPTGRLLTEALQKSLAQAPWVSDADNAAVMLAFYLAELLDNPDLQISYKSNTAKIYAAVLKELGLTVAGRADKPEAQNGEVTPLDEIRNRAAFRLNNSKSSLKTPKG